MWILTDWITRKGSFQGVLEVTGCPGNIFSEGSMRNPYKYTFSGIYRSNLPTRKCEEPNF
ncbi:TVG1535972 [Thermoplasma volcanium GSS1]|uniref:TVG1535972 protein n=1 Tax=Thermoplasma volcanium (strain ATCC 51530 / DSM 4299 / JCM 9571 / NBRC 15438 / GSS1) TaxID=273116 RepID=Q978D3_THEVO|nr:TVG1535972 [Thermoplasma volcanium GSS1]